MKLGHILFDLYYLAEQGKHSSEVVLDTVGKRLKNGIDPFVNIHFTHNTPDFNHGCINSSYKVLPTMQEKVMRQMHVAEIIRAVDASDVARLVIERHFIRDIKGNFNKFTQQQFRCVECNEKYRRPPLVGKCTRILNDGTLCGGKILFTITEGSIIKYLEPALMLSKKFIFLLI